VPTIQTIFPAIAPGDTSRAISHFFTPQIPEPITPFEPSKAERNLIAAVVSRAIEDGFGLTNHARCTRRTAKEWIICDSDENTPFTFAWCCLMLDLKPELIRLSLSELRYGFDIGKTFRGNGMYRKNDPTVVRC
jgi:hypothetical protein